MGGGGGGGTTRAHRTKGSTQSHFPHSSLSDDLINKGKSLEVNTENFLEEIVDRPIEADVDTQTDPFMDRPPSPLFVPAKTGVDRETQIFEGDLFVFDLEVEPLLQVLVGKTLEQSLMEVLEEEELSNMRAQQEEFDQVSRVELAEAQRMEEAEKRRFQEKKRRVEQERLRLESEKEVALKVASRSFSHRYVHDVVSSVFGTLNEEGFFYDPLVREIEDVFAPWLLSGVSSNTQAIIEANRMMEETIKGAVSLQETLKSESTAEYTRKMEEKAAAEAAKAERLKKEQEEAEAAAAAAAAEGEGGGGGDAEAPPA
jgi:hypothetical protein